MLDGILYSESYTYVTDEGATSGLVATHTVGGVTYSYTYDSVGNITAISENGVLRYSYSYDKLGQLTLAIHYSDEYYSSFIMTFVKLYFEEE